MNSHLRLGLLASPCAILRLAACATLRTPASAGPAIGQFYAGNFLADTLADQGSTQCQYGKHASCCLESQPFPGLPNQPKLPSANLKPGKTRHPTTSYAFGGERGEQRAARSQHSGAYGQV
ncbi:MAG: hypothetical protein ACRYFZ_07920 [Janthinobacterium lividum]